MPINISLHGHSLLPQKELPRAARRTVVNVQLIKDIRVVKCPGAEQTENLVDEGTKLKKKKHYKLALVHDDRRNTGDDCEGKD